MASLQLRHKSKCALGKGTQTPPGVEGCTCKPSYYRVRHLKAGGRQKLGSTNLKDAQREMARLDDAEDRGEYRPPQKITFNAWADQWKDGLRNPGENTKRSYVATLDYAKEAFGNTQVRNLTPTDVDRFLSLMTRERKTEADETITEPISASTQAKHLRVLHACLQAAVENGYAARNPVKQLPRSQKPKPKKHRAAYFTDDELPRLFGALRKKDAPLFRLALMTGMRQGELLALRWGDVELLESRIRVRRHYVSGLGIQEGAKSEKGERTIDLSADAVNLLGSYYGEQGSPSANALVFPSIHGKPRHPSALTRNLYRAMERAEDPIPRGGEHLTPPTNAKRTFHSLRHTYGRICMERGLELKWLQGQMGHATLAMTADRYGHFGEAARKREATKLEGAFNV
jgi:integrase